MFFQVFYAAGKLLNFATDREIQPDPNYSQDAQSSTGPSEQHSLWQLLQKRCTHSKCIFNIYVYIYYIYNNKQKEGGKLPHLRPPDYIQSVPWLLRVI